MTGKKRNPPTVGYWFVSVDGDEVYEVRMPKGFYSNSGLEKDDPMHFFRNELTALRQARLRILRRVRFLSELKMQYSAKLKGSKPET